MEDENGNKEKCENKSSSSSKKGDSIEYSVHSTSKSKEKDEEEVSETVGEQIKSSSAIFTDHISGRDYSVSPSGISQSSISGVLEWDPSADVGVGSGPSDFCPYSASSDMENKILQRDKDVEEGEEEIENKDSSFELDNHRDRMDLQAKVLKKKRENEKKVKAKEKSIDVDQIDLDADLTRSEIEYKINKGKIASASGSDPSSSKSESSVLWVKIKTDAHKKNNNNNGGENCTKSVQTSLLNLFPPVQGQHSKRQKYKRFVTSTRNDEDTSKSHSRSSNCNIKNSSDSTTTTTATVASSSSEQLSPTCQLFNKIMHSQSLMKDKNVMKALEDHRTNHINKIKKELGRLEHLNSLISSRKTKKLIPESATTLTSECSLDDNDRGQGHHRGRRGAKSITNQNSSFATDEEYTKALQTLLKRNREREGTNKKKTSSSSRALLIGKENKKTKNSSSSNHPSSESSGENTSASGDENVGEISKKFPILPNSNELENVADDDGNNTNLEDKVNKLASAFNAITDIIGKNKKNIVLDSKRLKILKNIQIQQQQQQQQKEKKKIQNVKKEPKKPSVKFYIPLNDENEIEPKENENEKDADAEMNMSLQEAFSKHRPTFLKEMRRREMIIAKIKRERQKRAEKKRSWVRDNCFTVEDLIFFESVNGNNIFLDSPKGQRVMTVQEMKRLTQRTYKRLPEVQEKKVQKKSEEEKKTNRIMSQIFGKKLHQGVLKGRINIEYDKSLIK